MAYEKEFEERLKEMVKDGVRADVVESPDGLMVCLNCYKEGKIYYPQEADEAYLHYINEHSEYAPCKLTVKEYHKKLVEDYTEDKGMFLNIPTNFGPSVMSGKLFGTDAEYYEACYVIGDWIQVEKKAYEQNKTRYKERRVTPNIGAEGIVRHIKKLKGNDILRISKNQKGNTYTIWIMEEVVSL